MMPMGLFSSSGLQTFTVEVEGLLAKCKQTEACGGIIIPDA